MDFRMLVETSRRIAETGRRLEKIRLLAEFLRRLSPDQLSIAIPYLTGALRQGKIGIGYSMIESASRNAIAPGVQPLTLVEVDAAFNAIAASSGSGSFAERVRLLRDLFAAATPEERDFLVRLIVGELRQGSLEGIMIESLARAADVSPAKMRAAAMLSGDLALAGQAALQHGESGLEQFEIRVLSPFQPMLAQASPDGAAAMESLETAALEYKMDGVRIQAHKLDNDVRIFTRNLNDVSEAVPDLTEIVRRFPSRSLVLDGETLSMGEDGRPRSFQITMQRFGRKLDVSETRARFPLTPFFFDCLYRDGASLLHRSEDDRFAALREVAPAEYVMPRTIAVDRRSAEEYLAAARRAGHEGIMAKALDAPYEPGIRSNRWLKIKPAHTLDLVIIAAEWGHGRRRGRLSNLHLGARDAEREDFVMLGKTFKGLTDAMLEWQTGTLLALERFRDQWTVYVRPELVVEVAFNDIQSSPHYPTGMALRFARIKRYRTDKTAAEADTVETVRSLMA